VTIVAANIIVVSPAQLATGRLSFLLEQVVARVSVLGHVDAVRQQVQRCRFRRLPRMMPQTFLALCLVNAMNIVSRSSNATLKKLGWRVGLAAAFIAVRSGRGCSFQP